MRRRRGSDPSWVDAPATRSRSFLPPATRSRFLNSQALRLLLRPAAGPSGLGKKATGSNPARTVHLRSCQPPPIAGALKKQQECAQVWWLLIQLPPPHSRSINPSIRSGPSTATTTSQGNC